MQAAGESRQLKRIVKNKKMGTTQRQLLLLFFLSAVAPQVRASSFFPSSALSESNPIHLHLPYTTAQHQQGNTKRKKAPSQTLSLAQICFTY